MIKVIVHNSSSTPITVNCEVGDLLCTAYAETISMTGATRQDISSIQELPSTAYSNTCQIWKATSTAVTITTNTFTMVFVLHNVEIAS